MVIGYDAPWISLSYQILPPSSTFVNFHLVDDLVAGCSALWPLLGTLRNVPQPIRAKWFVVSVRKFSEHWQGVAPSGLAKFQSCKTLQARNLAPITGTPSRFTLIMEFLDSSLHGTIYSYSCPWILTTQYYCSATGRQRSLYTLYSYQFRTASSYFRISFSQLYPRFWGCPKMGVPRNGWFLGNIPLKRMMTGGTPIIGNSL